MATEILSRLRRQPGLYDNLTSNGQLSREDSYGLTGAGDTQFTKGWRTGVAGISASSFADDALDLEAAGDAGWEAARDNALSIQQQSELYAPRIRSLRDIRSVGDAGDFAAGALGQGLASMAPTLATAALTRGRGRLGNARAFVGGMATSYQLERGEQALSQYNDPIQMQASVEERDRIARNKGLVGGALEALVPATLGRAGLRGATGSYAGKVGAGSLTEGATEAAQTGVGYMADRALNDQRELDPWEMADAFAMGALTGGAVSGVGNARDLLPPGVDAPPTPLDGAFDGDIPPRAPAPERIRPEDIAANGPMGFADAQPEMAPRADGVPMDDGPATEREPGDESPYDRLYRAMNERFGDSVRTGVGKATEAAGKVKSKVDDITERMTAAVEGSETPEQFFRNVFGTSVDDATPLELGDEDPSLAGVTLEETQANMARRREENVQRARTMAEAMMADESIPKSMRDRIAGLNGDYTSRDAQRFVGAQHSAVQAAKKMADATKRLIEFGNKKNPFKGGRVKRNNLMSGSPEERAQYTRMVFDGLTDEAKANPELMDRLPEIASAMVALSSRVGDLDAGDLANVSDIHDALSVFKEPEMLAAQIAEVAGITEPGTFVSKIMKISSARQDVKQSNSFLYSMLSEGAKDSMTTSQLHELAGFVDTLSLRSEKGQEKAFKALGLVFGSPERARMVMDYYRDRNRAAGELDDGLLADDEDTSEVDTTDSAEAGFFDRDAMAQGVNEVEAPKASYVFKDAKAARPFRVDQRSQAKAAGRQMVGGWELGGNTNRTAVPYSQYVRELGRDAGMELQRIVDDIAKRSAEALRALAKEYGIAKPTSDAAMTEAFNRAMAGEPSPNPKSTRIDNIKELYGELALLNKVKDENGEEAALDLYEVLKVEGNESMDLVANDEDIAAMGVDKSGRNTKTSTVTFTRVDGSKLALNAEAIWKRMHEKEGPGAGENRIARIRRLFAEGVAAVLNRDDIAGVENSKELVAGREKSKAKLTVGSLDEAVLRNKASEKPLTATKLIDPEKIREKLANLKDFQGELSALKKKLTDIVTAYADARDDASEYPRAKEDIREKIRRTLERNLGNYQRDLDAAKRQEQAYFAAKEQGKKLKPSSGLAFNKPAQAVFRRKIELYREALREIDSVDFDAAMEERDNNRAGMPGMDETGPYGKAGLNRTTMNEETTGEARRYEEDTGLGIGTEKRGSNPSAPMDEGEGKTKTAKFKVADGHKPAAAFGGRKVLAEKPANAAKVKELEAKMAAIRERVAKSPDMSEAQKQELRDHYADLQAELNTAKRDTSTVKAEVPPGDRIVSKRGARRRRDSRLNSIAPKDDRVQSAAEAAIKYLELLAKQGRAIPNHKRVVAVLKKIAAMGDFQAELASDSSVYDFDKMNAAHVPGLLRVMQKRSAKRAAEAREQLEGTPVRQGNVRRESLDYVIADLNSDPAHLSWEDMMEGKKPGPKPVAPEQEAPRPVEKIIEEQPKVAKPDVETMRRVFNIAAQDNWGRLETPDDVVAFAKDARAAYDYLKSKPEELRSDKEDTLLWSLESQFESNGYAAFDWASLFDGMEPEREHFEAVLNAIDVRDQQRTAQRIRKNSFVGPKADPEGAERAAAALKDGHSAEEVWKALGWFTGPDGKMRKEVPPRDVAYAFIGLVDDVMKDRRDSIKLADIFKNVPGMEKYIGTPLADIDVALVPGGSDGAAGTFYAANNKITLSIHHSVVGAVVTTLKQNGKELQQSGLMDQIFETLDRGPEEETIWDVAEILGKNGYLEEATFTSDQLYAMAGTFVHELQHAIQDYEGFQNGGNPDLALINRFGDLTAYLSTKDPAVEARMLADARAAAEKEFEGMSADEVAKRLYKNLAGETEARNVTERLDMPNSERQRTKPALMRDFKFEMRTDLRAVVEAESRKYSKLGSSSAQRPKRGRPAKVSKELLDAIKAEIVRTRGKDVQVIMNRVHSQLGASGEWSMNKDKTNRIIEIAVNAINPMSVARHEALHDFFAMLNEDAAGRSIKRDLKAAAEAPHVKRQLRELLKNHPEALKQIEEDAEERVAYMYQFWAEGVLRVGPRGTGIFQRIREMLRDLLGIVGSAQRAEDLLTALQDGKFVEPSLVAEVLEDMGSSRVQDKIRRLSPQLDKTLKAVAQAAPDRLRSYQNDNIAKIADLFSSEKGALGFVQKRYQTEGKWENKLSDILRGSTAVERNRALRNLQAMKNPSSKLEKDLAGFLSEIHDYMAKSGVKTRDSSTGKWVPIRKVQNYFPRVFDRSAILANETEWRQLLKDNGVSAEQINKITKAITHGDGQLDLAENPHSLGYTPYAEAVQDRKLTFITKANAHQFTKFQKRDLADILLGYSKQAAHRAEYAATFGNNGEVIQQLVEESGIKDEREIRDILTVVQALEGTSGYGMSSATKEVMASVMTMQNLVLLPLSLFSQMVDPIYLAARTGDIKDAGRAYLAGLERLKNHVAKNGKKIDGEEIAEMMGTISQDSVLEAMGVAYGSSYMSSGTRNVNRVFFKYTGMQGWNSSMRIVATRAGERYLIEHRNDAEALKELGLTPKDIKFSAMTPGRNGRLETRLDLSSPKMQQAMFRFVDQAVIRPSASQRPAWMSDPRFLLVAHLKQFIFAMHNVVLKRATQQLTEGNSKPWLTLMLAMPVILAADLTKFALTGSAPSNWGITDYIGHAVARSGLLGYGDFGNQVMSDAERGRLPGESLLGPAFEHAATVMRWIAGDARTSVEDVIARTVPGARFVD